MAMCSSVQNTLTESSAAEKLAARLAPAFSKDVYNSKTNSWSRQSNIYTNVTPLKTIIAPEFKLLPVPLADLTDLCNACSGWTRTKLTELIDNVTRFLNTPLHYIHKAEHDRIMTKFDQDLEELNKNFDEMFIHDFEGKYLNDIEFKQEIENEYFRQIVFDLINDYKTLLAAEELFIETQNQNIKVFADSFESFSEDWKTSLTPEEKAAFDEEEASIMW